MNKLYLIIILVGMLASNLPAQNKLIFENRIWEFFTYKGQECKIEQFCFDGTEQRYGKEYNKWKLIKKTEWTTSSQSEHVETELDSVEALLREENGKVYMLLDGQEVRKYDANQDLLTKSFAASNGEEALLYDFTVKKDDSFEDVLKILWSEESSLTQDVITNCRVIDTDYFDLNTGEVKKYTLQSNVHVALIENISKIDHDMIDEEIIFTENAQSADVLKEQTNIYYAETLGNIGRGNLTSLMPENAVFLTSGMNDYEVCYLTSVFDTDGTIIYGRPSNVNTLHNNYLNNNLKTYDLHGREVTSPVPGSIYIRDGKKFVAE